MKESYGDFSFRRLNKSGKVCLAIMGMAIIAFAVIDALWANGQMALPTVFEVPYQIIYLLWFAFVIFGLGVDKITISENSICVALFFTKKQEIEKSALSSVVESGNRIYFISIVASLHLEGRKDPKLYKALDGIIGVPCRFREKIEERGYLIES